jgi:hypothetical protein
MRPIADTMSGIVIIATEVIASQSWDLDRATAMRRRLEVLARELRAAGATGFTPLLAMACDHALDYATSPRPIPREFLNRLERWRSLVGALLPMVQADRDFEHDIEATRREMAARPWPQAGERE